MMSDALLSSAGFRDRVNPVPSMSAITPETWHMTV